MKQIIKILLIFLVINSCSPTAKSWHKSASKIGAKSIYINKDGTASVSGRIGDNFVIKYFDTNGIERPQLEKVILQIKPDQKNNLLGNQTFISDKRKEIYQSDYSKYLESFQ